jgi:chemotaxis signal transduction protein
MDADLTVAADPEAPFAPPSAPLAGPPSASPSARPSAPAGPQGRMEATHLLVRAGEYVCALPLGAVRQVLRSLPLHPLPGSAPELKGLAELAGDPLPVLDLARLARAPQGANPVFPVTVVAWAGPAEARELVGLAADAALDVAALPAAAVVAAAPGSGGGDGGLVAGEAIVGGQVVRVINLQALGQVS